MNNEIPPIKICVGRSVLKHFKGYFIFSWQDGDWTKYSHTWRCKRVNDKPKLKKATIDPRFFHKYIENPSF